jgi:glyoxylase-like metal-dependent hydrolase (beta-lactamase superfamily II)
MTAGRAFVIAGTVLAAVIGVRAQEAPVVRALTEPWPVTDKVQGIEILPVQKQVYMLVGAGANVTAQIGKEGVLLVDSGTADKTPALLAAVRHLTETKPLRYLVNTTADADHISGNGNLVIAAGGLIGGVTVGQPGAGGGGRGGGAAAGGGRGGGANAVAQNVGIMTISHEETANRMLDGTGGLQKFPADAIPLSTFFTKEKDLYVNGEPIELLWQPNAHTDGDVFVFFRGSDVVSVGDVYAPDTYPKIDLARGGSVQGEIDALNAIIAVTVPERNQMGGTRVIPGHGRLANEADVVEYRDMMTIVRDRVRDLLKKGATLEQVKAAKATLEYDPVYGGDKSWTGEMFLETVYKDMSQKAQAEAKKAAAPTTKKGSGK